MHPYAENMTADMLAVLSEFDAQIVEELKRATANLFAAEKAARITLPATAVSGKPVTHGARRRIQNIAEYWLERVNALERRLPREIFHEATGHWSSPEMHQAARSQ